MNVLITGAAGFLGRHLLAYLAKSRPDAKLHSIGLIAPQEADVAHHSCDLTEGDAVDALVKTLHPDEIYHLAGSARISTEVSTPQYFEANFLTTAQLARAVEKAGRPVSIFLASSVHVYGNQPDIVDESTAVAPISPYAHSKYLAELVLQEMAGRLKQVRVVIGRLYSCIGPGQPPGFVTSDLARRLVELAPGEPLRTGSLDGFRRFLDARDAVGLFPQLLRSPQLSSGEIVNIASTEEVSIREVVERLLSISGKSAAIESETSHDQRAFRGLRLKTDKLQRVAPEATLRPLDESLRDIWQSTTNGLAV